MLDNIEEKIVETFQNYEVKTSSEDILSKIKTRKKSVLNNKIFQGFGLTLAFVSLALLIIIPTSNSSNNSSSTPFPLKEIVNQKEYSSTLLSATDSFSKLLPSTTQTVNSLNDFNIETIIKDSYSKFESTVRFNLNIETLETTYKEVQNELYDVTYNYQMEINDLTFNQEYTYYFNINEEEQIVNGVIFNNSSDKKIITIKVQSNFLIEKDNYYVESNFTPQVFGQDLSYSFKINEESSNQTTYSYYISEEEIFSYKVKNTNNDALEIEYQAFENSLYYFSFKKLSLNSYEVTYNLYEIINGKFIVTYDLENKDYEINFNF